MELLGRESTHRADFGNGQPNPNRTMPWSGRLLPSRLLTRAQWYHFDPKPPLTKGEVEGVELDGAPISVWFAR
jgi:hypothetical protein